MHPILFYIGSFPIASYGVMIVIGLFAALAIGLHLAKKVDIAADSIYDLAFVLLLSGFIGARLLFILTEFDAFMDDPISMILAREGFVFLGGFITAALVGSVYMRRKKLPIWDTADVAAPALAVAHGMGRIGCFFAGCCYGKVCPPDSPWGVQFPHVTSPSGESMMSYAYFDHLHNGVIAPGATASAAVIPTQLIESAFNFVIFGILLLLWRRRSFSGQVFVSYLVLYSVARFSIEFLRGDAERGLWFNETISTSQILSILGLGTAAVIFFYLKPKPPVVRGTKSAHGK